MDNETESAGAPPHLRRNVLAWLLWCLLWSAGGRLMALGSVLPALASLLTPSKLAIGLLGSADLLRLPTQLLSAWLIRGRPRVLSLCVKSWTLYVVFPLGMGLALLWPHAGRLTWVIAFWGGIALSAVVAGFALPFDYEVQGRIFAGRVAMVSGITNAGVGITGMAAGFLVAWVLASAPFPANFGRAFVLAAALYAVSLTGGYLLREPEPPPSLTTAPKPSLRRLAAAAWRDRGFRGALLVYLCGSLAAGVGVFYVPAALQVLRQPITATGLFVSVEAAAGAIAGPAAGILVQRRGCRFVFALGIAAMAVQLALMARLGSVPEFYIAVALHVAAATWMMIAFMAQVLERAPVGEKGIHAALANVAIAPIVAVGLPLFGALIDHTSYRVAFAVALALPAASLLGLSAVPAGPPHHAPMAAPDGRRRGPAP